jgi:hypothetical protein
MPRISDNNANKAPEMEAVWQLLGNNSAYTLKIFPFATGVHDTSGCKWSCKYFHEFSKKLETVLMGYSGRGGS